MRNKAISLVVASLLAAPAFAAPSLQDLQELGPKSRLSAATGAESMRLNALKSAAIGVGSRGGLAARSSDINSELEVKSPQLGKVYNFRMLMISLPAGAMGKSGGTTDYLVLPPVIRQSNDVYNVDSDTRIHVADAEYEILSPARFVSAPPTWRDYLYLPAQDEVESPDASLLPKNDEERKLWREWIGEGWKLGVQQADAILDENLARLQRDFGGIVKYRELLAEGKVSRPFIAQSEAGVTGGGNSMAVGEKTLRITSTSTLNPDQAQWKPIVRKTGDR